MKKTLSFMFSFFILGSLAMFSWAEENQQSMRSPKDVLAVVNGKAITRGEFEEYHLQNLKFVGQRVINKEVSLQDLIYRELGIQKAKTSGVANDPSVIARQNDILFNAQVSKDLQNKFDGVIVTDDEVKNYYKTHQEYRTAHILYRVRMEPSPEEVKNALKQSSQIYETLKEKPEQFERYAKKFSQTVAAKVGGDIGFQPPTALAPEYFAAIKGKKVGQIIGPVRTQLGYHVIKILDIKPFDKIDKNIYKKIVYDKKRDAIMENYFKELAKGAEIDKFSDKL